MVISTSASPIPTLLPIRPPPVDAAQARSPRVVARRRRRRRCSTSSVGRRRCSGEDRRSSVICTLGVQDWFYKLMCSTNKKLLISSYKYIDTSNKGITTSNKELLVAMPLLLGLE